MKLTCLIYTLSRLKVEIVHSLDQLSKVFSDLIPETRYEVTIFAVNGNGAGEASDVLVVQTLPHGTYRLGCVPAFALGARV